MKNFCNRKLCNTFTANYEHKRKWKIILKTKSKGIIQKARIWYEIVHKELLKSIIELFKVDTNLIH